MDLLLMLKIRKGERSRHAIDLLLEHIKILAFLKGYSKQSQNMNLFYKVSQYHGLTGCGQGLVFLRICRLRLCP